MLIFIDKKIPEEAKKTLSQYGELVELETSGITYDAISGHPDIFIHRIASQIVVAPNLPEKYKDILRKKGIGFVEGEQKVGEKYPASSAYNAVSTNRHLIHNFRNTDAMITRLGEDHDLIHVDQGYTRCNLLPLNDDHFITSDEKVQRVLHRYDKKCLFVNPKGIILEGFKHGFFGGCTGISNKKLFIIGSLAQCQEEEQIRSFVAPHKLEVIELYNGPLVDGGSIIFLEEP